MAEPYIGEIRLFAGNFAPVGWALCNGSTLPISGNEALFNLIGTTYGGDGMNTFQLPDLQSRVPVHMSGSGTYPIGLRDGQETVTLTQGQMPGHNHPLSSVNANSVTSPLNAFPGLAANSTYPPMLYGTGSASLTTLSGRSIQQTGGGQAHSNLQPYLCITFIIAMIGVYPTPS